MKYRTFYKTAFSGLFALASLSACTPNAMPRQMPPRAQIGHLSTKENEEFGSDFDFPPLQQKAQDSAYWDVSDVDISDIDQTRKLISFTFDDAPSNKLERILAVFAEFNEKNPDCPATATLFCNGHLFSNASTHTLHTALALGWELGNHTYSHPDVTTLSAEEFRAEIEETELLLTAIDGKEKHLFRAPFGRINDEVKAAVNVPVIDWTIDTLDWKGKSADEIYDIVFSQKFSGAIVLLHDGYPNTVEALKRLLPDLKEAGYQVTGVSKMAKAHDCPLKNGGAYIRARKKGSV